VSWQPGPRTRGVSRSSRTRAGRRWAQIAPARRAFAGRATVSRAVAHTTGVIGVRQNRVVLTPGVLASSLVVMRRPNRVRSISHPQGDGAIVQRSRGEYDISRSNHCAGKAGMSPVALFSAMQQHTQPALGIAVHGSQPAPGLPCALVQSRARPRSKSSGEMRRENAKACQSFPCQSFTTALVPRTQRSASSAVRCRAGAHASARTHGLLGPGSAQQRKDAAARPGHERDARSPRP